MFTGLRVQLKNRLCQKNPVNNEKAWSLASRFFLLGCLRRNPLSAVYMQRLPRDKP